MTSAAVQRYFWREYRSGRSFWIAMFALTVGIQLAWRVMNTFWGESVPPRIIWSIAGVMPLIYGMAWAATSFSREHETGGFELLRALPASPASIWAGKLGFTLASSALLAIAVTLLTPLFATAPPVRATTLGRWGLWLLTLAGIGSLFSLWIKRPLTAVFAAGGFLALFALWPSNTSLTMDQQVFWLNRGGLFAVGLVALVISYPLARPWLQDRLGVSRLLRGSSATGSVGSYAWVALPHAQLGRLAWVSWRRYGWAFVILATLCLATILLRPVVPWLGGLLPLALATWPVLVGVAVFSCEQDPVHARLLVGQGVAPGRLWWQRQVLGVMGLGIVLAAFAVWILVDPYWDPSNARVGPRAHVGSADELSMLVTAGVSYILLAYVVGQWVSITVRSTLVALSVAGLSAVFVFGWAILCAGMRIPWWICVAMPTIGLLVASKQRAKPWLLEWNGLRDWWLPIATLVGTAVVLYTSFAVFRITEIPAEGPGFSVDGFVTTAKQRYNAAAAEQIDRVAERVSLSHQGPQYYISENAVIDGEAVPVLWSTLPQPFSEHEADVLAANEDLLTLSLDQAIEKANGLSPPDQWMRDRFSRPIGLRVSRLASLFALRARQTQLTDGPQDDVLRDDHRALLLCLQLRQYGASVDWGSSIYLENMVLDNLLMWAAMDPSVAPAIIDQLVTYWQEQPAWQQPIQVDYVIESAIVDGLPTTLDYLYTPEEGSAATIYALQFVPGEKTRLQRLIRYQTHFDLMTLRDLQDPVVLTGMLGLNRHRGWDEALDKLRSNTAGAVWFRPSGDWFVDQMTQLQETRQATLLRLLLIEYHVRTGEYPVEQNNKTLPEEIVTRACELYSFRQEGTLEDNKPWLDYGFRYERLPLVELSTELVRLPPQYVNFNEPLGRVIANAAGHLALVGRGTYPLPVVRSKTP